MNDESDTSISPARSATDLEATVHLFLAYAASLPISLDFQDFRTELDSLPGKYAPPHGELLLARNVTGTPIGCVALRPLAMPWCCEMKRLYVFPEGRGLGIGRDLVRAILEVASTLGYREVKLDTLPSMLKAIALYKEAGFVETEPYYDTPIAGTVFLARQI